MLGYVLTAIGSFLFGVIITCVLLTKKNLEMYTEISGRTENNLKNNIALAKGAYNAYIKDYEGEAPDEESLEDDYDEEDSEIESDEENG